MVAKLYFYYSAMNAGKSTTLLQSCHNYNERGMKTLTFIPKLIGTGKVISRIGLERASIEFDSDFNFFSFMKAEEKTCVNGGGTSVQPCACVMVDECQFLNKAQVWQLAQITDELNIPVLCYGLRSDFKGEPFEGSKYLLCQADVLTELKGICYCGRKATMNQRVLPNGDAVVDGAQVEVGGNGRYEGKCRRHWAEGIRDAEVKAAKRMKTQSEGGLFNTPEKTRAVVAEVVVESGAKAKDLLLDTTETQEGAATPCLEPFA